MSARLLMPGEYIADNGNVCGRVFVPGGYACRYVRRRDGSRGLEDLPHHARGASSLDAHLLGDGLPDAVAR